VGSFIEAGKTGELGDGSMKRLMLQGHEILLARIENKYYATDNRCPHQGGDLSAGKLAGTVVTCPKHSSQFDLGDGKVVRWLKGSGLLSSVGKALKPPRPLKTYKVKIEGDTILIEV
jgi:3-phenylpropionate/trans-cinnamate dioxygenase ferredoxin subunit